jgi:hypothetical protein
MQPIIHKAAIALDLNPVSVGISPGDRAVLSLNSDTTISVFVERPSRLPFGLGKPRVVLLGMLGARATDILLPALNRKADFRVRIIEVEPAHISRTGRASVYVSVWGDPADIVGPTASRAIFTRSRINDPVPPQDNS